MIIVIIFLASFALLGILAENADWLSSEEEEE